MGVPVPSAFSTGAFTLATWATGTLTAGAANDFYLLCAYATNTTTYTDTATCTGGSLTWTKRASALSADSKQYLVVFSAQGTLSSGTLSVVFNQASASGRYVLLKYTYSGSSMNTAAIGLANAAAQGAGTSASLAIVGTPAGDSAFAGFWGHLAAEAATPRTGWTELSDNTGTGHALECQYTFADDTTSASWTTSSVSIGAIVEVKNASFGALGTSDTTYTDNADTTPQAGSATSLWNVADTGTSTQLLAVDQVSQGVNETNIGSTTDEDGNVSGPAGVWGVTE